jgi:hypothetical protein
MIIVNVAEGDETIMNSADIYKYILKVQTKP